MAIGIKSLRKEKGPQVTDDSPSKDSKKFPVRRPSEGMLGKGAARKAASGMKKRDKQARDI